MLPPEAPAEELMTTVGAVVSMVNVLVFELRLTACPLLWAVAYTVWLPEVRAEAGVRVQLPLPLLAVTVPTLLPSTYTVTVLPPTAVPK